MATVAPDLGSKPAAAVRKKRLAKGAAASAAAGIASPEAPVTSNGVGDEQPEPGRRRRRGVMSDSHKDALALGREEGRAVRQYLQALEHTKPRRGRPVTHEGLKARLAYIDRQLEARPDPLRRLELVQQRMDTEREIENLTDVFDIGEIETAFIKAAPGYSWRKGISYEAWRMTGVDARVLKAAGIPRTRTA